MDAVDPWPGTMGRRVRPCGGRPSPRTGKMDLQGDCPCCLFGEFCCKPIGQEFSRPPNQRLLLIVRHFLSRCCHARERVQSFRVVMLKFGFGGVCHLHYVSNELRDFGRIKLIYKVHLAGNGVKPGGQRLKSVSLLTPNLLVILLERTVNEYSHPLSTASFPGYCPNDRCSAKHGSDDSRVSTECGRRPTCVERSITDSHTNRNVAAKKVLHERYRKICAGSSCIENPKRAVGENHCMIWLFRRDFQVDNAVKIRKTFRSLIPQLG